MRTRTALAVAALLALSLSACQKHDVPSPPPRAEPALTAKDALPIGKSALPLEDHREYRSPDGFEPELRIEVYDQGWVSTHRGADGFDVSMADPGQDAPLVVYASLTPPEATQDEALRALRRRARAAGAYVNPSRGSELAVGGGDGPFIESRDGGIALDLVPDGFVRVDVNEMDGHVWLDIEWQPDIDSGVGPDVGTPDFSLNQP